MFAAAGDSGSVVLNKDRKIIGHLIGDLPGITPAVYLACHIHPAVHFRHHDGLHPEHGRSQRRRHVTGDSSFTG